MSSTDLAPLASTLTAAQRVALVHVLAGERLRLGPATEQQRLVWLYSGPKASVLTALVRAGLVERTAHGSTLTAAGRTAVSR